MKKQLKILLALLLAFSCVLACVSCKGKGNEGEGGENQGGNQVITPEEEEENYRVRFVYSYTAKVTSNFDRTENKKAVVTVRPVYVSVDNSGFTDEDLAEIPDFSYNGYKFVKWYTEWDMETQTGVPGTEYDFETNPPITSDMTLYGDKGNLAGDNITWELVDIVYKQPEVEEVSAVSDTEEQTPATDGEETTDGEEEELVIESATLKLSGSGKMFDFANPNAIDVPWYPYADYITKVVVEDGITSIGANSFYGFYMLADVDIPDTIERIGEGAFYNCNNQFFSQFIAPSNLKTIGKNAFRATKLTMVMLNEGCTTLEEGAFYASNKIASVLIPSTLNYVGIQAFHPGKTGTSTNSHALSKVYYNGDADNFAKIVVEIDNECFNELSTIYYYSEEEKLGNYWHSIDNTIYPVQYCYTLSYTQPSSSIPFKTIFVPATPVLDADGKVELDDNGMPKLEGIITKAHVEEQKAITYHNRKFASFSGGKAIKVGVTINEDRTYECDPGKIMSEDGGIKFEFSNGALRIYKDNTTEKRIQDDEISIALPTIIARVLADSTEDEATFRAGFEEAVKEDIRAEVEAAIEAGTLTLSASETVDSKVETIFKSEGESRISKKIFDNYAIAEEKATYEANCAKRLAVAFKIWDFESARDMASLYTGKFSTVNTIKSITIEEGVEYIGRFTFASISNTTEVVIPATVSAIHKTAFDGCSNLVSIYYADDILTACPTMNELAGIRATVYSKIEAGESVSVGNYWMELDDKFLAWTLDESGVLTIGGDNEMVNFENASAAPWYESKDSIKTVHFAKNITSIGEYVLNGYDKVTAISLPNALKVIPESAFAGTGIIKNTKDYKNGMLVVDGHLLKVDPIKANRYLVETYTGVVTIAEGAFSRCSNIKRLYVATTVQYIHAGAFPDADIEYIFVDGGDEYWATIEANADFGDAYVLYKSNTKPGPDKESGKYWYKVGSDYAVWGCMHVWSDWVETLAPTCASLGTLTRYCVYDATHIEEKEIPMETEHTFKNYVPDNNATCQSQGTMTAKCEIKGCEATDPIPDPNAPQKVLTLLPGEEGYEEAYLATHQFDNYVSDSNWNCAEDGTLTATCAVENCTATHTKPDPDFEKRGDHKWGEYVLDPDSANCEHPLGTKTAKCENKLGIVPCPITHTIDAVETDYTEAVTPVDHSYVENPISKYLVSPATKDAPAKYNKSCEWCGKESDLVFESGDKLSYYTYDDMTSLTKGTDPIANVLNYTLNDKDGATNGNYAKISTVDTDKTVLEIGRNSNKGKYGQITLNNNNKATPESAVYVFDTDFMIDAFTMVGDGYSAMIAFSNGSSYFLALHMYKVDEDTMKLCYEVDGVVQDLGITFDIDVWYNLRFECVVGDGVISSLTVTATDANDAKQLKVLENLTPATDNLTFNAMLVELRCYAMAVDEANHQYLTDTQFYFDNTYIGTVDYTALYRTTDEVTE